MSLVKIVFKNKLEIKGILIDKDSLRIDMGDSIIDIVSSDEILYMQYFKEDDFDYNPNNPNDLEYETDDLVEDILAKDALSLTELRLKEIEAEKDLVKNKLKNHEIKDQPKVSYGTPNFSTFKIPK